MHPYQRFVPVLAVVLAATALPFAAAYAAPSAGAPARAVAALWTPAPQSPSPTTPAPVSPAPSTPAPEPIPLPAPGRPVVTNLSATGATLTWTVPAGPVFRFSMQRLVDGVWQGYTSMPFNTTTFTQLTPATTYTVRVFAHALAFSGYTSSPPSEPVTFTTPGAAALSCSIDVRSGRGRFAVRGTVANQGTEPATAGWAVDFTLARSATITGNRNSMVERTGTQVTVRNTDRDPAVSPGSSMTFVLVGSYTGQFATPTDFRLGATACQVPVG